MKIEVSLGEALDKLNVLELKYTRVLDPEKRLEIHKEIEYLQQELFAQKNKYAFFYKLLSFVNEIIWDQTDEIKKIDVNHPAFSSISDSIFQYNQKRFRIKSWFNTMGQSAFKEQKSYTLTQTSVYINHENTLYDKIPELNFILLDYDVVHILTTLEPDVIRKLFTHPHIQYKLPGPPDYETGDITDLETFTLTENRNVFEFPPIRYVSGGCLGDFIHQLSVVYEKFLETGRKGVLYIDNQVGDRFRLGIETTFHDTSPLIRSQKYIQSYQIYKGEPFDINLSSWRTSSLLYKTNWYEILKDQYGVDWGSHPWLTLPKNDKWKDRIIINYSSRRPPFEVDFQRLQQIYGDALVFMAFEQSDYQHFVNRYSMKIEYICPDSLYDFAVAIHSCRFFIGGLSSPLTFAFALHKNYLVALNNNRDDAAHFHLIENHIPNRIF